LQLDGETVAFTPGETLLEVARRAGRSVPTLCHDDRLVPAGACRMCLVAIDGQRRLAPSCATVATAGLVVATAGERVDRHRRTLLAMYLSDLPTDADTQVHDYAATYGAPRWPGLAPRRADRASDPNPYIQFRADRCIVCAQCVRYCDEVEAVNAITVAGRGASSTIATAEMASLLDTTCELCGGCVAVCPTGALTEKRALGYRPISPSLDTVRTTCNYCGVGCQLDLQVDPAANDGRGKVVKVTSPPPGQTTNDGNLCVKGRFAYEFIDHADRLDTPLVRGADGALHPTSWDDAIARVADGLLGVRERHGADALGFVSSSRCTVEENYLMQKLARAVFGTNNVHQCAAT
jgi:predicted molibdopterin-dependent oxidoreductase YjgC